MTVSSEKHKSLLFLHAKTKFSNDTIQFDIELGDQWVINNPILICIVHSLYTL